MYLGAIFYLHWQLLMLCGQHRSSIPYFRVPDSAVYSVQSNCCTRAVATGVAPTDRHAIFSSWNQSNRNTMPLQQYQHNESHPTAAYAPHKTPPNILSLFDGYFAATASTRLYNRMPISISLPYPQRKSESTRPSTFLYY